MHGMEVKEGLIEQNRGAGEKTLRSTGAAMMEWMKEPQKRLEKGVKDDTRIWGHSLTKVLGFLQSSRRRWTRRCCLEGMKGDSA